MQVGHAEARLSEGPDLFSLFSTADEALDSYLSDLIFQQALMVRREGD